jgi:uncharacterized membrane protein YidH (DUF202 family)
VPSIETTLRSDYAHPACMELWFDHRQARNLTIFGMATTGFGLWCAALFILDPDRVVTGRHAWAMMGHGKVGMLFGILIATFGVYLLARGLMQWTTAEPALRLSGDSLLFHSSLLAQEELKLDEIQGVVVESYLVPRGSVWLPTLEDHRLAITRKFSIDEPNRQPIHLARQVARGGLESMRSFADTMDRALAVHRREDLPASDVE